jgi:hypothetical protein
MVVLREGRDEQPGSSTRCDFGTLDTPAGRHDLWGFVAFSSENGCRM